MQHLSEDELEEFLFGFLPEGQTSAAEEHLLGCEACQESLESTARLIRGLRARLSGAGRSDGAFPAQVFVLPTRVQVTWDSYRRCGEHSPD